MLFYKVSLGFNKMVWLFSAIKPRGYGSKFKLQLGGRPLSLLNILGKAVLKKEYLPTCGSSLLPPSLGTKNSTKCFLGRGDDKKKFLQNVNGLSIDQIKASYRRRLDRLLA